MCAGQREEAKLQKRPYSSSSSSCLLLCPLERVLASSQADAPRPLPSMSMTETPSSLKPSLEYPFILRACTVWHCCLGLLANFPGLE